MAKFEHPELEAKIKNTQMFQRSLSMEILNMAMANLRRDSNKLCEILDLIPALIFIKDKEGNLVFVNRAAAQSGSTTADKMENTNSSQWWPADLVEKWKLDDQEVFRLGHSKRNIIEQIEVPSTGQRLWVRTDKHPLYDDDGEVKWVLVFAIDITNMVPRPLINQGRSQ